MALFTQGFLQVAGCEVYAYCQRIIIAMGKLLWNALAQTADAYYHLCLIVYPAHEIGDKEGFPVLQQRGIGLGEYDRITFTALIIRCALL